MRGEPRSSSGSASPPRRWRYALAYFALFSNNGVITPYLQILLRRHGYGPAAVGLLIALFETVGIFGPIAVTLRAESSATRGKRSSSRLALAGTALCIIASAPGLAIGGSLLATAASIAVLSLGAKSMAPLMDAEVVSVVSAGDPARGGYGVLRSVGTLGFICVALTLQAIPGFDRSPPWKMAACLGATGFFFLATVLYLPSGGHAEKGTAAATAGRGRRAIDPVFLLGLAIIGIGRISMAPISSFLSLYASEGLGLHAAGGLWAISAAAEIPLMIVGGAIIARIGPMASIAISSGALILRLVAYAAFPSFAGIAAAQLLHSLSFGLFHTAAVAFVAERVPPERRASGMAAYFGLGTGLPTVMGSALGGFVVERWGYRTLFLSFTVFAFASLALYFAMRRRFSER
jgi:PPP family 3-phenylpropionic acid transporter